MGHLWVVRAAVAADRRAGTGDNPCKEADDDSEAPAEAAAARGATRVVFAAQEGVGRIVVGRDDLGSGRGERGGRKRRRTAAADDCATGPSALLLAACGCSSSRRAEDAHRQWGFSAAGLLFGRGGWSTPATAGGGGGSTSAAGWTLGRWDVPVSSRTVAHDFPWTFM